jgi:TolB protein
MNADGTNKRKLTPSINTSFLSPSWSPDGTEIAFAFIDRDWGTNGIAKMNSDGSELIIKIFENSGIGYLPEGIHWSKDGRIFYNDIIEGNSEIFSVNPDDGSDKIRITNTPYNEALPDISPNGDRLVFVSDQFGGEFSGLEIMSMAIDETDIRRITNTYEMEVDPKYSNEGTKLLYSRWNSVINAWQMYLSNPDGTAEIPLFVDGRYPAWKPKKED